MTTEPVTIEQAAALLGVSASTVRRRIRAGILQVRETRRPQGTVWLVHLPSGVRPATATDTVDTASVTTTPPEQPASSATQAEAISTLVQTTVAAVLGPLVGQIDVQRQTIERQAEQIAELREERGRHAAELERAASTIVTLADERDALKVAQTKQAANPGPVVPAATTNAPTPLLARLRALGLFVLLVVLVVALYLGVGWLLGSTR